MSRYSTMPTEQTQDLIRMRMLSDKAIDPRVQSDTKLEAFTEPTIDDPEDCIPDWPSGPQTLAKATPSWGYRLLPHYILLFVPTASIGKGGNRVSCRERKAAVIVANVLNTGLGIAVFHYNNKAESHGGDVTKQAMAVTATLWPILFASVLGPMLKAAALYCAQRGAKLGVSSTPFGRYFSIIDICIRSLRYFNRARHLPVRSAHASC
jgi:hypothetical protein